MPDTPRSSASVDLEYATGPETPPHPSTVRPTSYPVLVAAILIVLTPLVAASQIAAHLRLDVVDDQMFGYFGWRIAHDAVVYKDVWDNKPPGIYWINALGFLLAGGESYAGVIALCIVALVVAHIAFFVISASIYYREAAALATILASFYLTHGYYQCGTNRTETFLVACELSAVALYVRGFASDRAWKWLGAGLLCGMAFLFKQVGLAGWGAMGLHTIWLVLAGDLRFRDGLRRCVLLLAGVLIVIGIAAAALAVQGALGEALFATFGFNRAYFAVGESNWPPKYDKWSLLTDHLWIILLAPVLMTAAGLIHGFLWWLRPALRPADMSAVLSERGPAMPRYLLFFSIWFVAAMLGALVSPHAFRHYLVPTIPPLMLLAGYLIHVLMAEMSLLKRMAQRAWVTVAFVLLAYFASEAARRDWEEVSRVWVERIELKRKAEWEVIGERVASLTRPDEKIQCWGYMPGVYLVARRPNVCRFTTTEKMGQVKGQADFVGRELREKLMADPPAVFCISGGDYLWLHGTSPDGRQQPVDPLGPWIEADYEKVEEQKGDVDWIFIFKRKAATPP